jgi:hypothetical protein
MRAAMDPEELKAFDKSLCARGVKEFVRGLVDEMKRRGRC